MLERHSLCKHGEKRLYVPLMPRDMVDYGKQVPPKMLTEFDVGLATARSIRPSALISAAATEFAPYPAT